MSDYKYSVSMIVPAAYRDAVNQFGEALRYGPDSLSRGLSPNGQEPATHYGGHTWSTQAFLDIIAGGLAGVVPPELEGQDPLQVQAILGQLQISVGLDDDVSGRWSSLLSSLGLQTIQPEDV